jgi:hypothetical protein
MAPQEANEVIVALESGRAEMVEAVSGLTDEQAKKRPTPERWSVLECVEHVTFVELRFLSMLKASEAGPAAERDAEKEAAMQVRVVDRSNRRNAPEAVHPQGKYSTVAEALEAFHAQRDETVQFAKDEDSKLSGRTAKHLVLGTLNGVETVLLIAGHGKRHTEQIREALQGR